MADDFVHIVEPLRALAVDLRELIHDPANARTHDRRNLDAIKASLRAYGQRTPIVVQITSDGRRIIRKGNGTTQAARELAEGGDPRWWMIAAVEVREDSLSATGYAIADNRTSELAAWDDDVLGALLQEVAAADEELLATTGFSDEEMQALLDDVVGSGSDDGDDGEDREEKYTLEIKAPIYEPTGPCPDLGDLVDLTKTRALIADMETRAAEAAPFARWLAALPFDPPVDPLRRAVFERLAVDPDALPDASALCDALRITRRAADP